MKDKAISWSPLEMSAEQSEARQTAKLAKRSRDTRGATLWIEAELR